MARSSIVIIGGGIAGLTAARYLSPHAELEVTLRRPIPSGGAGDTDVYGAQQHVPLMLWRVPIEVVSRRGYEV